MPTFSTASSPCGAEPKRADIAAERDPFGEPERGGASPCCGSGQEENGGTREHGPAPPHHRGRHVLTGRPHLPKAGAFAVQEPVPETGLTHRAALPISRGSPCFRPREGIIAAPHLRRRAHGKRSHAPQHIVTAAVAGARPDPPGPPPAIQRGNETLKKYCTGDYSPICGNPPPTIRPRMPACRRTGSSFPRIAAGRSTPTRRCRAMAAASARARREDDDRSAADIRSTRRSFGSPRERPRLAVRCAMQRSPGGSATAKVKLRAGHRARRGPPDPCEMFPPFRPFRS